MITEYIYPWTGNRTEVDVSEARAEMQERCGCKGGFLSLKLI